MPPSPPAPYTKAEVDRWAHERRPHEREPVPEIGERVLLREVQFGEPVPAVVHDVEDMTGTPHNHWNRHGGTEHLHGPGQPDVNVWQWDAERAQWRLKDDPWPWVHVRKILGTDGDGNEVLDAPRWCREARVRGSAGWLREGSRAHTGRYESEG